MKVVAAPDIVETPPVKPHQPVWPLAEMYPYQGEWSENEYLRLRTNRIIEFVDGYLEFPPMPTDEHQGIVAFIYESVTALLKARGFGVARFAPLRLRVAERSYREPDILVLLDADSPARASDAWLGADLVVEVVSADDPARDYVTKREEYAAAGVREYWIVDPTRRAILVLGLEGSAYREIGTFAEAETAQSRLLPGLNVKVAEVFAAANR